MEKERKEELFFDGTADLVRLEFTDLFGQCKMVEMTAAQAAKALKDGYAINHFALGGLIKEGDLSLPIPEFLKDCGEEMELYLKPDLDTAMLLPWESGREYVGRVICDVCNGDGTPSWTDSRNVLKQIIKKAEEMGLKVCFDFQCEFYLFHTDEEGRPTTVTHEVAGYYDAGSIDLAGSVRRDMILSLAEAGMEVESTHHGLTPGQHSFLIPARCGIEAGDYLQTFRTAVKRIAKSHGLHAAFMPKPNMDGDGSGLHVGVYLRGKGGTTDRETAEYFRAGVLKHLRDMMIFTNPMVNSYKRLASERKNVLQPEFPATVWENACDKAVRLIREKDGTYAVQVLFPDPAVNPYLALAAILSAGLMGIKNQYDPAECGEKLHFPETLGVLIGELRENQFALQTFGEKLCRMYREGKKEEWDRFCAYVTDWEIREYLYRC